MPEEVFYKLALKLPWSQMFWAFENRFFCTFFSEQVENVFRESKARLCKSEVGHRKHSRKLFWNYLEVKSKCTTEPLKKAIFSFFVHFWAMKLKPLTVKAKPSVQKSLNPKLIMVHGKHFRKCFQSNPVKPECSELLKRAFFSFLQIFEWWSWNQFLGKWSKEFKTI